MEVDVPGWTTPADVRLSVTSAGLDLRVGRIGRATVLELQRTFKR